MILQNGPDDVADVEDNDVKETARALVAVARPNWKIIDRHRLDQTDPIAG